MIKTFKVLPIIVALILTSSLEAGAKRPNILFLLSDDQRPDTIAALGNPVIKTPHLDRLVREGTTFTRATCAHPLCFPSRAEILTGTTGFQNGVYSSNRDANLTLPTLPEVLQVVGYQTWWVGKWHIAGRPSTRGFSASKGLYANGRRPKEPRFDARGRPVTGYTGWMFQTDDRQLFPEKGVGLTPEISSLFADAAIEFLNEADDEPFFLWVNFTAPHDPLLWPPGWEKKYEWQDIPLPENFSPRHPFDHGNYKGRDEVLLPHPRTPEAIKKDLATYYAVISHMDQQIGRIMNTLDDRDLTRDTYVIFASDHGLALGSHGLTGKQNMYEHTINVPFIMRGPDIPAGKKTAAQCYLRDLYPTICEWAEVLIPQHVDAQSLVPILNGDKDELYPFIVGYFQDKQRMIRTDRCKYVEYPQVNQRQLFDLKQDPLELENVIDEANLQERIKEMRTQLVDWLVDRGDPLLDQ